MDYQIKIESLSSNFKLVCNKTVKVLLIEFKELTAYVYCFYAQCAKKFGSYQQDRGFEM